MPQKTWTSPSESLITSIKLYKKRPTWLHLYALPMLVVYIGGIFIWQFLVTSDWFETISNNLDDFKNAGKNATELLIDPELDSGLQVLDENEELTDDLQIKNMTEPDEEKPEPWPIEFQAAFFSMFVCGTIHALVALIAVWSIQARAKMIGGSVKILEKASHLLVIPCQNNGESEFVELKFDRFNKIKYFMFQKIKYIFDTDKNYFEPVTSMYEVDGETPLELIKNKGLSDEHLTKQKALFGSNKMVMEIPPFLELFKERATAPFFVFQIFCVLLWSLDDYWYYSLFTLFMLVTFECTLVQQQIRSMTEIRNMGSKSFKINTLRNGKWVLLESDDLCPGDIVSLKSGKKIEVVVPAPKIHPAMANIQKQAYAREGKVWQPPKAKSRQEDVAVPCDMILLSGRVIVDEAMLTGESVPQVKNAVELNNVFDIKQHSTRHIVFGGTKIVQHEKTVNTSGAMPEGSGVIMRTPDNGCPAIVIRTSFRSSQGTLLRTILYGAKRVTANNWETFCFILFLLFFAIAAVWYLWEHAPPNRSKYQLVLESILILTSVVPPELPIELSLAVNNSLLSLTKLQIFCTEPFRIPFAGKVDVCCFDKTGTLTTDTLVVDGVTDIETGEVPEDGNVTMAAQKVLATCHALVLPNDDPSGENIIGDPLEKVCLGATTWKLAKGDTIIPEKAGKGVKALKIVHRHHFSSFLKRMSVISSYDSGSVRPNYLVATKGAAEVVGQMLVNKPENYDQQHQKLARKGIRVLALAYKELSGVDNPKLVAREKIEQDLEFAGFVCVNTPLKKDSVSALRTLRDADHHLVMITGDHVLTATYVALKTYIVKKGKSILVCEFENDNFKISEVDYDKDSSEIVSGVDSTQDLIKKVKEFGGSVAMTGQALEQFEKSEELLYDIIPYVSVFARTSPQQKELIINVFKAKGFTTLMCGDGTNDVGALKHAQVGVALLAGGAPKKKKKPKKDDKKEAVAKVDPEEEKRVAAMSPMEKRVHMQQQKFDNMFKKWETDMDEMPIVKLGDASIASPFTSKQSSVQSVCHIIRQGRCTLVTTLQMFKILALNSLVMAYSNSVLRVENLKFSDYQITLQGMMLAGCFFFVSRSLPTEKLSRDRPLPNVFNWYTLSSVMGQFGVHLYCLAESIRLARIHEPREENPDYEAEFKPTLINSLVFIIGTTLQVCTFAVNYRGEPFMVKLTHNKPLIYSICGTMTTMVLLAGGYWPEMADGFSLVAFPDAMHGAILRLIAFDLVGAFCIDRGFRVLFGKATIKPLHS